jgi:hypothetical protein
LIEVRRTAFRTAKFFKAVNLFLLVTSYTMEILDSSLSLVREENDIKWREPEKGQKLNEICVWKKTASVV